MPCVFPGAFRVRVFRNEGGAILVGAIELASPGNKDRAEARRAFAAKCANYLYEGVSLIVVDVVSNRHGNLHNEIVDLMRCEPRFHFGREESLYGVGYRPVHRDSADVRRYVADGAISRATSADASASSERRRLRAGRARSDIQRRQPSAAFDQAGYLNSLTPVFNP